MAARGALDATKEARHVRCIGNVGTAYESRWQWEQVV